MNNLGKDQQVLNSASKNLNVVLTNVTLFPDQIDHKIKTNISIKPHSPAYVKTNTSQAYKSINLAKFSSIEIGRAHV